MHRQGFSGTRSTDVLDQFDPAKQQAFVEALQELKRSSCFLKMRPLSGRSSHWRDLVTTGKAEEDQNNLPPCGIGMVALATGAGTVEEYEESTAETFQQFLQLVLNRYLGKQIDLILDTAKIHHAKALTPFLVDHPELHLLFLPPYSPNLNNVARMGK